MMQGGNPDLPDFRRYHEERHYFKGKCWLQGRCDYSNCQSSYGNDCISKASHFLKLALLALSTLTIPILYGLFRGLGPALWDSGKGVWTLLISIRPNGTALNGSTAFLSVSCCHRNACTMMDLGEGVGFMLQNTAMGEHDAATKVVRSLSLDDNLLCAHGI